VVAASVILGLRAYFVQPFRFRGIDVGVLPSSESIAEFKGCTKYARRPRITIAATTKIHVLDNRRGRLRPATCGAQHPFQRFHRLLDWLESARAFNRNLIRRPPHQLLLWASLSQIAAVFEHPIGHFPAVFRRFCRIFFRSEIEKLNMRAGFSCWFSKPE